MSTHTFSALDITLRADLHPASLVYRSRLMDRISDTSSDLTTGSLVMRKKRELLTGLAPLDDISFENGGAGILKGVARSSEEPGIS